MMRVALLLVLALAAPLSGCLACQPLLEVRHCLDGPCEISSDAVGLKWTPEHAQAWPDIDRLMQKAEEGEHEHLKWSKERQQALFDAFGLEGKKPELLIDAQDGEWYRVRVLRC